MTVGIIPLFLYCHHVVQIKAFRSSKGKAQAEVVVAVVRGVVVAIRHTTVPRVVVPTATTVHTVRA